MADPAATAAFVKALEAVRVNGAPEPQKPTPVNVANTVTLLGYGLGLWWTMGGPAWSALASIALDEVDGVVARERGECTSFGSTFDWGTDIILTALSLRRVRAPAWTIPAATVGQVYLRDKDFRPPVGSLRAGIMLYGVIQEGYRSRGIGKRGIE